MDTSRVSSKWQIVIPRQVREAEQIRIGSQVTFERTRDGILLRVIGAGQRTDAAGAFGILATRRRPSNDRDIAVAARSAAARKERARLAAK
jgi:AbrB family looped-hinge helix DNA binding protein